MIYPRSQALAQIAVQHDVPFSSAGWRSLGEYTKAPPIRIDIGAPCEALPSIDALICSWKDRIDQALLERMANLKYIGLRCTSTAQVDVESVAARGIKLTNISNYGDCGTAEFVIESILSHFRHRSSPNEVSGRQCGIIGLGAVGSLVANAVHGLGMRVCYHARNRVHASSFHWCRDLAQVLATSEVITFHTPPCVRVMNPRLWATIRPESLVIITTLGLPDETESFVAWAASFKGQVVLDGCAAHTIAAEVRNIPSVRVWPGFSARTAESIVRAERSVLANLAEYVDQSPAELACERQSS